MVCVRVCVCVRACVRACCVCVGVAGVAHVVYISYVCRYMSDKMAGCGDMLSELHLLGQ